MTVALSPQTAQREIERVVARARQHPENLEHWFQMMPAGSRDMLAFSMFQALVEKAD